MSTFEHGFIHSMMMVMNMNRQNIHSTKHIFMTMHGFIALTFTYLIMIVVFCCKLAREGVYRTQKRSEVEINFR